MPDNIQISGQEPKISKSRDYFSEALQTAQQVRSTLEPVEVSQSFADRLRAQLDANVENAREMMVVQEERKNKRQWMMAGTSGFVYLIALAYLSYRLTKRLSKRVFFWRRTKATEEVVIDSEVIVEDAEVIEE